MAGYYLDLKIISATDLKGVPKHRTFRKMRVFASVSINESPELTWKTPVDRAGGTNPKWNAKTPFILSKETVEGNDNNLFIKLYSTRKARDFKCVGEVQLSLKDLFDNRDVHPEYSEYPVTKVDDGDDANGEFGILKVSHHFYEKEIETSIGIEEFRQTSGCFMGIMKSLPLIDTCAAGVAKSSKYSGKVRPGTTSLNFNETPRVSFDGRGLSVMI